jgi:hypothetical protein
VTVKPTKSTAKDAQRTMSPIGTLTREVRNTTAATLTKGSVVYISGATGNKPTVSKAIATGDSTSAQTFGLVQADIAANANGNVVCVGDLTGLDTSAFTEGAQLYLSSTTAGAYTVTKQLAPAHLVYIGIVTRAHPTLGQVEVNIQNGYELYELHDVSITSVANNQGLFYEASTDLWKNKSIATVLGYTPANGADYMALTGTQSIAGNKYFTGFGLFDNTIFIKQDSSVSFLAGYNSIDSDTTGIIFSLPAGNMAKFILTSLTASRDYTLPNVSGTIALTSDLHNAVTIGTANGLSLSTQVLSLALASTSATGALSSTDWNTFNGKQNALTNPVTGTGTTNYLPKFTGASALGNSILYDTGSVLLVGATSASNASSKLELVSTSTVGLKIISSGANGNNTFLSIQASKEWRFLTNRGDLIAGNQGDLIIRNETDSINHIILNQGGSTTFAGTISATGATLSGALGGTTGSFSGTVTSTTGTTGARITLGGFTNYGVIQDVNSVNRIWFENTGSYRTIFDLPSAGTSFVFRDSSGNIGVSISSSGAITAGTALASGNALVLSNGTNARQFQLGYSTGAGYNYLQVYDGTAFQPLMVNNTLYVTGTNVGIGTTAPNSILEIAATTPVFRIQASDSASFHGIEFRQGAGFDAFIKQLPSTGEFRISNGRSVGWGGHMTFYTDTAERMRITSGGYLKASNNSSYYSTSANYHEFNSNYADSSLLIRNTNATPYGLWVLYNGASPNSTNSEFIYCSDTTNSKFIVWSNGSVINRTGSYGTISDIKFKENIVDATPKLGDLAKLKVRNFNLIGSSEKQIGFIAQEFEEIFPNMVDVSTEKGTDGETYKYIKTSVLVTMLVKAIQELNDKVKTLEKK